MQKKHNYLRASLLIFLLLTIGIAFATTAFGAEVDEFKNVEGLGSFTKKIFDIAMMVVGGLAGIAFIIGAVQYMASSGNPTTAGEGKSKMISAILGVTLTLGSLIILRSINPQFETVGTTPVDAGPPGTSVLLTKPASAGAPEVLTQYSLSVPSLLNWPGYTTISYVCPNGVDPERYTKYFLIRYADENYKGAATKTVLECGNTNGVPLGAFKSYKLVTIRVGVYLFNDATCNDIVSENPLTASIEDIGSAKSIVVVHYGWFGAALSKTSTFVVAEHQSKDYQGSCSDFYQLTFSGVGTCKKLGASAPGVTSPASLTIVQKAESSSGDGIKFWQDTENKGGVAEIKGFGTTHTVSDVKNTTFDYSKIPDTLPAIKDVCKDLSSLGQQNCPGSAKVLGNYVVKLKAEYPGDATPKPAPYCLVFSSDVQDFYKDNKTLFGDGRKLKSIEILEGKR